MSDCVSSSVPVKDLDDEAEYDVESGMEADEEIDDLVDEPEAKIDSDSDVGVRCQLVSDITLWV